MIIKVNDENELYWAQMCSDLFSQNSIDVFINERKLGKFCNEYLYCIDDEFVGMLSLSIRNDYVEGTNSSPVGYIEGIYIKNDYRNKGIAKKFINFAKKWAIDNNCFELASDCELGNPDSYEFHKKMGFEEANRIVCFKMDLK